MSYMPFPAIELAMIARVKAASDANVGDPPAALLGYHLRQVESYEGQLNGGPKRIAELVRASPAVWICFENATRNTDSGLFIGHFAAVCVAQNARNQRAARHGAGGGEVGVYQIGKDVVGLIDGHAFDIESVGAARVSSIDTPYNAEFEGLRVAIMLVMFQMTWDPDAAPGPLLPDEAGGANHPDGLFATFNVDWDIPPFTDPEPAIPVDDESKRDARDVIHPPQ
jgi:phage gp37-like protein